jgi:adenine deaminase
MSRTPRGRGHSGAHEATTARSVRSLARVVAAARGDRPVDLLLRNARLVNVFSGEVEPVHVAVDGGVVVGFGERAARASEDLGGGYLCPGFIDSHFHIESSMLLPAELARAVVPCGTTTVIADPHEIANVLGVAGVELMLALSEGLPLAVYLMAPSCVPATSMETAGGRLDAASIRTLLQHPRVLGLAEVMNFPGVIHGADDVLAKLAHAAGRPIDGHAPGLQGRDLQAYLAAGIGSDHECTTLAEAREKLGLGMHIFLREGSAARNLAILLPLVTPATERFCSFCTDDRHPADLQREGHIDHLVRSAIRQGLDAVLAIRLATLNAARHFGLRDRGAVAPGYRADLVVVDDLERLAINAVYVAGVKVAEHGRYLPRPRGRPSAPTTSTMHVDPARLDLVIHAPLARAKVRVISVVPGQVLTRALVEEVRIEDACAVADPARDLLKLAVVERHTGSQLVGLGFVNGLGLRRGALASSVAHDSHNIVVAGASDRDMLAAIAAVVAMGGGQVAVADGRVLAALPLPIAGLLSDLPLAEVCTRVAALAAAARGLGCPLPDPFMPLSFLALPVIPELKLTDRGLVDVTSFQTVPLFLS